MGKSAKQEAEAGRFRQDIRSLLHTRVREAIEIALEEELAGSRLAVEYAEVRDPARWSAERPRAPLARAVALLAARAGNVRLIDNRVLSGEA